VKKRGSIYRKYVVLVVALVGGALLASGLASMYRTYVETRAALLDLQREKAEAASIRIENFVESIERQIGWTSLPQVVANTNKLEARRFDYIKLLRQVKEITEATYIDAQGREQVRESRIGMSAYGSGAELSEDPRFKGASTGQTYFGPVIFRKETEPYMAIAVPIDKYAGGGVTAVDVNLKFMWEVIQRIRVGKTGFAYVVDRQGRLIAHPDISLVLQKTDLSSLPQVRAGLPREGAAASTLARVSEARDLAGKSVLTASARIESLGWTVFVEQSVDEAYRPLYASLMRTGGLLVAGLALAMIAGFIFARRMVEPIRALQAGADALGEGDLARRIEVRTGDELEALGERFNEMASKLAASYAGLERKVEERTQELQETLERQTATSEVLRAISGSPTDTAPVFDAILNRVVALCDARVAALMLYDGELLRPVAGVNVVPALFEKLRNSELRPAPWNPTLLAALERRTVHATDILDFPEFRPLTGGAMTRDDPWRTVLAVPLMREGALAGVITAWRKAVRPFTDKQIELVSTFADQAVIAIENVRLFNETTEALEQQTATAEILRSISASPSDVAPVFEAILDSAARLCDSPLSAVFRYEGGIVHLVSHRNWSPSAIEEMQKYYPGPPNAKMMSGRTILSGTLQQEEDTQADPGYDQRVAQSGGWRRMLGVPIKRGTRVLGAVIVGWPTPGKTPERQMRLLETFAEQAAIAIENVRLFNETKEALEQQQASAEVLGVISSSVADTQPVFNKILESCKRLFAGLNVGINVVGEDGQIHVAAFSGPARDALERVFPVPLGPESGSGAAILKREVLHYPDIELADVPEVARRGSRAAGNKAVIFAPILWEGKGIGAIHVGRGYVGPFSDKEIALLRHFADQTAIAIQNARLFHEIEEKSRQLEIANKHKSDFLANMSHELRTPLNAIIGFSEVLIEKMFGEVNEKQLDYLQDIHASGRHLLSLINDILDLSKIEAGRMELDLVEVNVPDTLSSALTLVRERAQNHGIQLALEVDPKVGVIQADERKVKQVVLNLLSNAVKFTPDGGKIAMRATLDTDHVAVAVHDTGIGIAPEDQEAVFEEFKQVGRDYTKKAEGTGLGLALTRRIVELHGGRIWLESAPGKGSTFTFTLPLTQEKGAP
jgi:signal transduction histidine kinase